MLCHLVLRFFFFLGEVFLLNRVHSAEVTYCDVWDQIHWWNGEGNRAEFFPPGVLERELVASPLIPWRTLRQTVVRSPKISAKISGFAWESWIYMA